MLIPHTSMVENSQSAEFIQWSENGTSFVVSSISEFSRLMLASHFKHSNVSTPVTLRLQSSSNVSPQFSSFVRQLNLYGFHKLNRTPHAQRDAEDQIWEFSHPYFLRGRPDLLDQIQRTASKPPPLFPQLAPSAPPTPPPQRANPHYGYSHPYGKSV
jgi:heat shock transcription factor